MNAHYTPHMTQPIPVDQSGKAADAKSAKPKLLDQQVMASAAPTLAFVRLFRTIDTDSDNRISKEDLYRHQNQEGFSDTFAEVRLGIMHFHLSGNEQLWVNTRKVLLRWGVRWLQEIESKSSGICSLFLQAFDAKQYCQATSIFHVWESEHRMYQFASSFRHFSFWDMDSRCISIPKWI